MKPVLSEDMKQQNRSLVYQYIQGKPGQTVTRTELSRNTGISGPTILKIFDFFVSRGLISPNGEQESGEPGRRSSVYRFNPNAAFAVGASYDGQVLELSLVNLNHEVVLHKTSPLQTDLSNLIGKILPDEVPEFTNGFSPLLGIGISLPAVVDTKNRYIKHQAYPALQTRMSKENLAEECAELERRLSMYVLLENDVNCAAIAEYRARGFGSNEDFIYVMLGAGLGAGLILDGKLRRGAHFTCGEIGSMVMDPAFAIQENKSGHMEWEVYRHTLDRFGIDLLEDSPPAFPYDMIRHIAAELSLVIANLANSLDVSTFVMGGFVYEKIGFSLIKLLNQRLKEMCLQDTMVSGPLCKYACANGAASLLIGTAFENLLSDHFSIDGNGEKNRI